jgi:hypothetical protein
VDVAATQTDQDFLLEMQVAAVVVVAFLPDLPVSDSALLAEGGYVTETTVTAGFGVDFKWSSHRIRLPVYDPAMVAGYIAGYYLLFVVPPDLPPGNWSVLGVFLVIRSIR